MLEKIFLSYHFDAGAKALAAKIEYMLKLYKINSVTGEHVGGGQLTDKIKANISECDAFIFILSKRDPGRNNDWVMHEVSQALLENKRMIGFIENGLPTPPVIVGREYIDYDDIHTAGIWFKLIGTLNKWIRDKGRSVLAIVQPEDIASTLRGYQNLDTVQVRYRLHDKNFNTTHWKSGKIRKTPAGVSVLLGEVLDDTAIELQISTGNNTWTSIPKNQELQIDVT